MRGRVLVGRTKAETLGWARGRTTKGETRARDTRERERERKREQYLLM